MGGVAFEKCSLSATFLPVRLQWANPHHSCLTLLDSGAEENFLDITSAHQLKVPVIPLILPLSVNALGDKLYHLSLILIDSPLARVVLGHPSLILQNPNINWQQSSLVLE